LQVADKEEKANPFKSKFKNEHNNEKLSSIRYICGCVAAL
jgi:hypothetical protein